MSNSSSAADQPAVSRLRAWTAVAILTLLYLFSQIDRLAIYMAVVPIKESLGLGDFRMSLILGPAFAICYAIAPFPLAWLADRTNRRLVVFCCVNVWALATCATAFTTSFETMFAARMMTGIGEAALMPCAYVIISRLFPADRLSFALSVFSLGTVGGIALGFGVGGWLMGVANSNLNWPFIGQLAPWRSLFLITGLPCFFLALLLYFVPDPPMAESLPRTKKRSDKFIPFLLEHRRASMAIFLGFGLSAYCTGALLAWLPSYTQLRFGWSANVSGPIIGLMVIVVATFGKLGSGVVVDALFRRGRVDAHASYLLAMFLISGPVLVGAFFVSNGKLFIIMVASWFLLGFPVGGYGPALVQLITPTRFRTQASAGFTFSMAAVGAGLGPTVVGAFSEYVFVDNLGMALVAALGLAVPLAVVALVTAMPQIRMMIRENAVVNPQMSTTASTPA